MNLCDEAYERALESLRGAITDLGFMAAAQADGPQRLGTYAAVWARDGVITALWTLDTGESDFVRLRSAHAGAAGQASDPRRAGPGQRPARRRAPGLFRAGRHRQH